MKKYIALFLAAVLLLSLCACGETASTESDLTAEDMAAAVLQAQEDMPAVTVVRPSDELYGAYLALYLPTLTDAVEDGIICAPVGVSACEVTIFFLKDEAKAEDAGAALRTYLDSRIGAFTGYAPEQAALAKGGRVIVNGRYAALLICPDPDKAEAAFYDCFSDTPPTASLSDMIASTEAPVTAEETTPETTSAVPAETDVTTETATETAAETTAETVDTAPAVTTEAATETAKETTKTPETTPATSSADVTTEAATETAKETTPPVTVSEDDLYDARAVRVAWRANDASSLSPKNAAIFYACRTVIDSVIKEGMSDYEKELAVHDWIIDNTEYDTDMFNPFPGGKENPDNDNPYGVLIGGRGICLGYARSFQLFMDILGISCLTVEGTSYNGTEPHAWNMVQLDDGKWYCVDVTWDDPVTDSNYLPPELHHNYFNVTSYFLKERDHQWDEEAFPVATGTLYVWKKPK